MLTIQCCREPGALLGNACPQGIRCLGGKGSAYAFWFVFPDLPLGRSVDCSLSRAAARVCQVFAPKGVPRLTDLRTAFSSSSVSGRWTRRGERDDGVLFVFVLQGVEPDGGDVGASLLLDLLFHHRSGEAEEGGLAGAQSSKTPMVKGRAVPGTTAATVLAKAWRLRRSSSRREMGSSVRRARGCTSAVGLSVAFTWSTCERGCVAHFLYVLAPTERGLCPWCGDLSMRAWLVPRRTRRG